MKFIKAHLLQKARSRQHFYELLLDNGLFLNYRNGIPDGIIDSDGKKYLWQKLGIDPADLQALEYKEKLHRIDERLQKLEQIRSGTQPDQTLEP